MSERPEGPEEQLRLVRGIAHDLNNVLAVVVGHADMALERLGEGDAMRGHLDEVAAAARRGAELTRRLLALGGREAVEPRPGEPAPRSAFTEGPAGAPGRETLLLVEDEAVLRSMISRMLRTNGYGVIEAASGTEALRLWQEGGRSVDLVLTDVVMPGMSGLELASRLAAAAPGLGVLLMSGCSSDEQGRPGLEDRRFPALVKPFSSSTLVARIRELLGDRAGPAKSGIADRGARTSKR